MEAIDIFNPPPPTPCFQKLYNAIVSCPLDFQASLLLEMPSLLHFLEDLDVFNNNRRYAHSLKLWKKVPINTFQTSLPQK